MGILVHSQQNVLDNTAKKSVKSAQTGKASQDCFSYQIHWYCTLTFIYIYVFIYKWKLITQDSEVIHVFFHMYRHVWLVVYFIVTSNIYNRLWMTETYQIYSLIRAHDDVIKWKDFPRYWPFVRGIHRSPVNSPHKGQWRGALMFSLIYVWINGWVNNNEAGDLMRYRAHYDVIVMNIWLIHSFASFTRSLVIYGSNSFVHVYLLCHYHP